jgi:positive regulator of sigma E activity
MSPSRRETGTVVEVTPRTVTVEMQPESPEQCAACGCCGDHRGRRHVLQLAADRDPRLREVRPGDRLDLEIRLPNQAVAALLLFGLPLAAVLAGAWLGWRLAPQSDNAVLLGGGGGFVLGGGLVWLCNRWLAGRGLGARVAAVHSAARPEA